MKTYNDLGKVPSYLKTKNQLLDLGLVPTANSEKIAELLIYIEDYNTGSIPCVTYDLYDIGDTEKFEVNENTLNAQNICEALYSLNTSDNKYVKNKAGKIKERWDTFYSLKPEILSLLHSEGRVQLLGYQDSFENFGKYNTYYIFHNGETKYGFHIPIKDTQYRNIETKLYYLGKSDDKKNKKMLEERPKKHKSLSDDEVLNYFTFLNGFIDNHNK
ncbi:TPA: hypothetical protein ACLBZV_000942 [Bacillus cereus]|uniref:hypothetical protein n=1 Tax=Bacillus sp. SRB1LM TaxID=2608688 RepID=UPI0018C356FF|nr:hypothetical protein [Bacillus sp. SRB1LM]MBG0966262.1 hypothetical protein [Bacillus sp. SRB1LM]HDR6304639.1 hypothetical protein [Bacillus cereus]